MASKTITISEDAYLRLKRLKRPGESFTDVVQRLTGREDLMRFAGTISEEFAAELEEHIRKNRERIDREMAERRRLWED